MMEYDMMRYDVIYHEISYDVISCDTGESQGEGQKVVTRKVEDGQKTLFPELSRDLWGVICYHH